MKRALAMFLWLTSFAPAQAQWDRAAFKSKLGQAEELLADWDIPGAKKALADLEKSAPRNVEPLLYYKGRIAFEEGHYPEAIRDLSSAGVPDAPGSYLRLAKDTQKIMSNHAQVESEHFIFIYPPGKDEILAPYALDTLEAQRKALADDLGYAPPEKVRVEVVNDAHELAKVSTLTYEQIRTTGTIAICKFSKLMVTSPKAVLRGYDWQDTLAHEFTHLVVTRSSRNSVPIWLHEGLAKYLESRWRGEAGQSMSPSTLALLGSRLARRQLIPFEKMHPSIALLPTAEDAATAFAEVFFAVDLIYREKGTEGLRVLIAQLSEGKTDKQAVEEATGAPFSTFENAWRAHLRKQRYPKGLLPAEKVVLKEQAPAQTRRSERKKEREISFGDFAEMEEPAARRYAHLGELLRERRHTGAAAEEYGKAYRLVGDKYEALSNKYALALMEQRRLDLAEKVLLGSLRMYPGIPATQIHLGRIYLSRGDFKKAQKAYFDALSADPFDPEIHLALFRIHQELGDKTQEERERHAASLLTGAPPREVDSLARALVGRTRL